VPSRRITDNALITFECIHEIQRNNAIRGNFYAYKLDLSKAYDRVDWGFLRCVLEKLGFHQKSVQWVMTCVTSVQYCVRFNGGLRQGDPLLPYLFLLVVDCLSTLMKLYEKQGLISGIKVSRRAPSITHLLFANDSLLFFKLGTAQATKISELLALFEKRNGQKLSPAKCSILVREGASQELITKVRSILNVEHADFDARYLGLPMPEGRMQGGVFKSIEERYIKRMADWKERLLS
jgi:hypothetical protein